MVNSDLLVQNVLLRAILYKHLLFHIIKMPNKQIRVSPNSDWWWRVHKPGAERDSAHTWTKREAVQTAQRIAGNQWLETKIQNQNWRIAWWNSYGRDPFPPRDQN